MTKWMNTKTSCICWKIAPMSFDWWWEKDEERGSFSISITEGSLDIIVTFSNYVWTHWCSFYVISFFFLRAFFFLLSCYAMLANSMTECSHCLQKCNRNSGHRICIPDGFALKFWVEFCILIYTHTWQLIKSVDSHCSSSCDLWWIYEGLSIRDQLS